MADKINMSLDDIIKMKKTVKKEAVKGPNPGPSNKNAGNKGRAGAKGAGRKGPPAKNARVALANKVLKKSKAVALRAGAQRAAARLGARRPVAAAGMSTVATKKLVNKLVKNALRKRTNITSAQVVRKRGGVAASTLAGRRNLATRRNIAAGHVLQPVRTVIQRPQVIRQQVVRQPPVRVVQHVQPAPVQIVRQVITAPPVQRQVIRQRMPVRRNQPPQQSVRRVPDEEKRWRHGAQHIARPTVIRRVIQQAPRRVPQYEQVVQRVQVAQPQRQVQRVQRRDFRRPQQGQRQPMGRNNNVRYVQARPQQQQRRTVLQQVERYQPVQYVTERVVTTRGRGFRAM